MCYCVRLASLFIYQGDARHEVRAMQISFYYLERNLKPEASHFHFDIYTRRKIEIGKRIDDLWRGVHNIDEALVDPHLKLLARGLIDER